MDNNIFSEEEADNRYIMTMLGPAAQAWRALEQAS